MRWFLLVWLWAVPALACEYDALVAQEAALAGLPPQVVVAIMHAESSGNPKVIGPGGARGLFQFEERTWAQYTILPFSQAFEPRASLRVVIPYLQAAHSQDPRDLVAWHNAGVRDWRKLQRRWSVDHPNRIYRAIYRGELQ